MITWLHLSDLHYQQNDKYNRRVVLDALWQDISQRTTRISPDLENIDFISVTGDIAYHGESKEYDLAIKDFFQPLLEAANPVDNSRLFIVPGNHDIDRKAITTLAKAAGEALKGRDDINEVLATPADRALVFGRLSNYFDFFKSKFPNLTLNELGYFYVAELPLIANKKVAILGLNSA